MKNLYLLVHSICDIKCKLCNRNINNNIIAFPILCNLIDKFKSTAIKNKNIFLMANCDYFYCPKSLSILKYLLQKNQDFNLYIQTFGIINILDDLNNRNKKRLNFLVNVDGNKNITNWNRGKGQYQQTISFIEKALTNDFNITLYININNQNFDNIDSYTQKFKKEYGDIGIIYRYVLNADLGKDYSHYKPVHLTYRQAGLDNRLGTYCKKRYRPTLQQYFNLKMDNTLICDYNGDLWQDFNFEKKFKYSNIKNINDINNNRRPIC